ncbi:putative amino acid ABC transporter, periplasmic binding protein [Legionella feeleii]|uniref:Putative amino acid ABC transporter, periplasmic binding protein n=2 Tax=Legionella feeleii TaxID=453 RepID=A0A378IU07_9GAMM|nr:putative amino acid ABC transporter, periplasmic binding protein [Legionella feeleii]
MIKDMKIYRFTMILFCIFISPLLTAQEKVLKIAVAIYDPPFVMQIGNNQFYGFDIAMMEDVCRRINYTCQFIATPNNRLIERVRNRQADLAVSSIIITVKRLQQVNFSLPYLVSQARFLGPAKLAAQPFDIDLLDNKKIGITDNAFLSLIKMMGVKKPKVILFEHDNLMIQALRSGAIDIAFVDNPTAHYWHMNSSGSLRAMGEPITFGAGIGIAVNRNNFKLLSIINPALLDYQNSEAFKEDYHKYLLHFSTDTSPQNPANLQ